MTDPQTSSPSSPSTVSPGATRPSPPSAPTPAAALSLPPLPPDMDGGVPSQPQSTAVRVEGTEEDTAAMIASLAEAAAKEAAASVQILKGAAALVGVVDAAPRPASGGWKPPSSEDDAMDVDPRPPPPAGDGAFRDPPRPPADDWSHLAGLELFPLPPPQGSTLAAGAAPVAETTAGAGPSARGAASASIPDAAGFRTPQAPANLPSGGSLPSLPPLPSPPAPWSIATGPWIGLNGEPLSPTAVAELPGAPPASLTRRPHFCGRPARPPRFPLLSQSVAEAATSKGIPPAAVAAAEATESGKPRGGGRPPLPSWLARGDSAIHWYSGDLNALLPPLMNNAARLVRVVVAVLVAAGNDPASISMLLNADKAAEFVRETELSVSVVAAVIERRVYVPYSARKLLAEGAARGDSSVPATRAYVDVAIEREWRNLTSTAAEAVRLVAFPLATLPRSVAEATVPRPPSVTAVTDAAAAIEQTGAWAFFAPPAADGGPPADVPPLETALELLLSCPSVTPDGVLGALVLAARARRANATLVLSAWTMGRLLVATTATVVIHASPNGWVVADELGACGLLDPAANVVRLVSALKDLLNGRTTVTARDVDTMDEVIRVRAVQLGMGNSGKRTHDTPDE